MISYSLFSLSLFFEPFSFSFLDFLPNSYIHTHAHKYTHINSPLGVCCFHYLQLGPKTAFRVEYSRAELARIAVYIESSLVIASSLFSLSCASGGKYESGIWGPPLLRCATTRCNCLSPHQAQVIGGKQRA